MDKKPVQTGDETEHDLLEQFRKGAKLAHLGTLLENEEIELKAFDQYKEALTKLEVKSPMGRDALIPLLSDPDSGNKDCSLRVSDQPAPRPCDPHPRRNHPGVGNPGRRIRPKY